MHATFGERRQGETCRRSSWEVSWIAAVAMLDAGSRPPPAFWVTQNIGWSLAALSGTGCKTSQCSTTLPSSKRKKSAAAVPRSSGEVLSRLCVNTVIRRITPALLGLFFVVTLFAHRRMVRAGAFRQAGWHQKRHPTFADALALVRRESCGPRSGLLRVARTDPHDKSHARAFMERLTDAICYAA